MGSVNTWRTFEYCLDYFRYFLPMSGSLTTDGEYMADIVRTSGHFVSVRGMSMMGLLRMNTHIMGLDFSGINSDCILPPPML